MTALASPYLRSVPPCGPNFGGSPRHLSSKRDTAPKTHGMSYHPLYNSRGCMIHRCHNEKSDRYCWYGARGIKVCDRWRFGEGGQSGIECFVSDIESELGGKPSSKHTLDRRDNDGNYEPGNMRWATPKEQSRNTRRTRFVEINGERISMGDACERLGLKYNTIRDRLWRGRHIAGVSPC